MSPLIVPLVAVGLAALLTAAGRTVVRAASRGAVGGWVVSFAAGLLVLDLLLLATHWAGLPWSRWTLLPPLVALAAPGLRSAFAVPLRPRLGAGDAVGLLALGAFALLTATGWLIFPDLVYHWGTKAAKFAAGGGLDLAFLREPTPHALHPDYPILLSGLIATTLLLSGGPAGAVGPWAGMAWGPILAGAAWWAGRRWLAEEVASRATAQLGSAGLGLFLAFHGVAFRRATDAGWLLVLALLLAAPALVRARRAGDELRVGVAAGLAAAAKLEGMALALFVVAAWLLPGRRRPAPEDALGGSLRRVHLLPLLLPAAAVSLPWLAVVARHDLSPGNHWSGVHPERLAPVLRAMLEAAGHSLWAGFGILTLALLAALGLAPGQRRLAAVLALQLGVYLAAYLATPLDPIALVETSFARLLGHLTPAALVAAVVAAGHWAAGPEVRAGEA